MPDSISTSKPLPRQTGRWSNFKDLTDQRFGRWTVKSFAGSANGALWNCVCDCGTRKVIHGRNLRYQHGTKSCGCAKIDAARKQKTKHGMVNTSEYRAWAQMKERCFNPKCKAYRNYGGRGISVCEAWVNSFQAFFADMGPKPSSKCEIDRIENNGDYCPSNCRWTTHTKNNRNRRNNRIVEFNGELRCVSEWSEVVGISVRALLHRLNRGWSVERALSAPVQKKDMVKHGKAIKRAESEEEEKGVGDSSGADD